jgi:hypothetical protein
VVLVDKNIFSKLCVSATSSSKEGNLKSEGSKYLLVVVSRVAHKSNFESLFGARSGSHNLHKKIIARGNQQNMP